MMTTKDNAPEREEIEMLLPWHAAGTLSRRDAERVEQALGDDAELARRFDMVREELGETIHLNETLGAPSARSFERLFASIEANSPAKRQVRFDFAGWISGVLSQFSPRTLAWSATAAAVAIALQAGLLAGLYVKERAGQTTYETASHGDPTAPSQGAFVLIRFHPTATVADITKFLDTYKASITEGPKAGMYRVRVAASKLAKDDLAKIVTSLQQETTIVGFIVPVE